MHELVTLSELIDKLITTNIKLYNLLNKCAELDSISNKSEANIKQIVQLNGENIRLVKNRSELKTAIDLKIKTAIITQNTTVLDEVKNYG